jgi:hypothetical protein
MRMIDVPPLDGEHVNVIIETLGPNATAPVSGTIG